MISIDTQAILLLTSPLSGRDGASTELLSPGEFNRLERVLRDNQCRPADLIAQGGVDLIKTCATVIDGDRLTRLLERGFLLSQAVERWQARGIWVVGREDDGYPRRLKARLRENAPALFYGCGDEAILDTGGLAIVGSRDVNEELIERTQGIGRLAAEAGCTVFSGAARGIDQAAMRGALEAGGKVGGVMADGLERAALARDHRQFLMDGRLVLISPYDPTASFNVGHAMQRNKVIYALADAGLVMSSDFEKGGTWAGAVEQLKKFRFGPVFVHRGRENGPGLEGLIRQGALVWPELETSDALREILASAVSYEEQGKGREGPLFSNLNETTSPRPNDDGASAEAVDHSEPTPIVAAPEEEEVFAKVKELVERMNEPATASEVAQLLEVDKTQAEKWLRRLVQEGVVEKISRPVRYRSAIPSRRLF